MASNKTSVSGVAVYAQQFLTTTGSIPTGMVTDAYADGHRHTVTETSANYGYKIQLLPSGDWRWPIETDWVVTYTATAATHRFVLGNGAFTVLFT